MGKASTFSTKNSPKGKQKGSGKSGSKSVPSPFPKSAFKKAIWKKGGNLKKPKKPDLLHYTGHQPGVMTMFLVDGYNDKKDSFRVYDVKNLKENDDLAEELQITSVTFRKGEDGMKMPQSPSKPNYGWRMYVSIIGENNNTPEGRKAIAENLKNEFNKMQPKIIIHGVMVQIQLYLEKILDLIRWDHVMMQCLIKMCWN